MFNVIQHGRAVIEEMIKTDHSLGTYRRRLSLALLLTLGALALVHGAETVFEPIRFAVYLLIVALTVWYAGFCPAIGTTALLSLDILTTDLDLPTLRIERLALFLAMAGIQTAIVATAHRLTRAQAENLRLRDTFLSIAAHELKTPITSLLGFAQIGQRQLDKGRFDPQSVRHSYQVIELQSRKLTALVTQLLEVSRFQQGHFSLNREVVDAQMLVRDVVDRYQQELGREIVAVVPQSVLAYLDPIRMEEVLINLIDNAIKYSPPASAVLVSAHQQGEQVWFRVRDTGFGIPPKDRAHIFEQHYQVQTSRSSTGMGLGLYICREIVERHGGTIAAEFPTDGGTVILVNVPKGLSAEQEAPFRSLPPAPPIGKPALVALESSPVSLPVSIPVVAPLPVPVA